MISPPAGPASGLDSCAARRQAEVPMLYYTVVFLIVAIIAGALGFGSLAGVAASIAKVLFFVFLVLFVLALLRGRKP